jgi:hypothetical protein
MATTALLSATFAWAPLRGTNPPSGGSAHPLAMTLRPHRLSSANRSDRGSRNITTEADLGNMQIVDIVPVRKGVHRVITK